jgi:hypothetical protein
VHLFQIKSVLITVTYLGLYFTKFSVIKNKSHLNNRGLFNNSAYAAKNTYRTTAENCRLLMMLRKRFAVYYDNKNETHICCVWSAFLVANRQTRR